MSVLFLSRGHFVQLSFKNIIGLNEETVDRKLRLSPFRSLVTATPEPETTPGITAVTGFLTVADEPTATAQRRVLTIDC